MRNQGIGGYTLIELLVVIAIIAVSVTFSFHTFGALLQHANHLSAKRQMLDLLAFARSEAVSRGTTITFCPSMDGDSCTSGSARQLIVFNDADKNHFATPPEILRYEKPVLKNAVYEMKVSSNRGYLRFRPEGTAIEWGTITLCPDRSDYGPPIQFTINYGGRARLAEDKDGDGTPEDVDGKPITCSE